MALDRVSSSPDALESQTSRHDDDGVRPALIACTYRTVGSRTFTASGAAVWNDLPAHVTAAPSLAVFTQHLKTFPFLRSYSDIVT